MPEAERLLSRVCVFLCVFQGDLVTCGVLSGNKNFEGRLCDCVRANYLASPPLVVAYAIAGTVDIDFRAEPLGSFSFVFVLLHPCPPSSRCCRCFRGSAFSARCPGSHRDA